MTCGLTLTLPPSLQAKIFHCGAAGGTGDVPCLIDAIHEANANGEKNTIRLKAGTYTLTDVDNTTPDGPNGLPSITSPLTIKGEGADTTILERASSAPVFRLVHVAASGHLRLTEGTIRGGGDSGGGSDFFGGGLYNNGGTVHLVRATVAENHVRSNVSRGGGLYNNGGTVHLVQTTITQNQGGGLFSTGGTVRITRSRLTNNSVNTAQSGGLQADGGWCSSRRAQ